MLCRYLGLLKVKYSLDMKALTLSLEVGVEKWKILLRVVVTIRAILAYVKLTMLMT